MTQISCPNCKRATPRAGFGCVTIGLAIVLFPIGLLFLLRGRKPTRCLNCDYRFLT